MAKVDIEAFAGAGWLQGSDGAASFICGEPLIGVEPEGPRTGREWDLAFLHRHSVGQIKPALRNCNGVFTFVHLTNDAKTLILAGDHLGIRPIFYLQTSRWFIFSSALRVLEQLPGVPRSLDPLGLAEFATFGYSLGDRTPIREVSRILPAELITVTQGRGVTRESYYSWTEEVDYGEEWRRDPVPTAFQKFQCAVRRRLQSDSRALAFLSGGLDSRAIVSLLRSMSTEVHTFNFPIIGEQDEILARRFAKAAATIHTVVPRETPVGLWDAHWCFILSDLLSDLGPNVRVPRPKVVWSGDGGSVCVGGSAALSDEIEALLMDGDIEAASARYAPSVILGALPGGGRSDLKDIVRYGVQQELERIRVDDHLRRFHLFLVFNNQRRHLDQEYENIDLHRLELQLPFFDTDFLRWVLGIPYEYLKKHRFYHDWIGEFPHHATSVPWQTYPGHLPCPVPIDDELTPTQWQQHDLPGMRAIIRSARRTRLRRLGRLLVSPNFPHSLLSRSRLTLAGMAYALKLWDYEYVLDFAHRVDRGSAAVTGPRRWPESGTVPGRG